METVDDDVSERSPAGGWVATVADMSLINAGLQAGVDGSGIIVVNDRDWRSLARLRKQVGDAAIEIAIAQLAGQRRPYVSNVVKALGIAIPSDLVLTGVDTARTHIAASHSLVKKE